MVCLLWVCISGATSQKQSFSNYELSNLSLLSYGVHWELAQKILVMTSNSQTMHCLTMHTRNTRPMLLHLLHSRNHTNFVLTQNNTKKHAADALNFYSYEYIEVSSLLFRHMIRWVGHFLVVCMSTCITYLYRKDQSGSNVVNKQSRRYIQTFIILLFLFLRINHIILSHAHKKL